MNLKISEEALAEALKALSELSSALTKLHSNAEKITEKAKKSKAASSVEPVAEPQDQLDGLKFKE